MTVTAAKRGVIRELEKPFRRNGYNVSLVIADYDQYVTICNWCDDQFGERYGVRYYWFEDTAAWQFFTRSDFALFTITWGGQPREKTG